MPFELFYLPSYERCLKKMGSQERTVAGLIVSALLKYFQSGLPIGATPYVYQSSGRSYRLVFQKIHDSIWEAYIESRVRILTRLEKNRHFLVFVGNHGQVRQFLKNE